MSQHQSPETVAPEELVPSYPVSGAEYVHDALQQHSVEDTDGIQRPAYSINGREVVFRTRLESPQYDDADVVVPGGASVYPLELETWSDDSDVSFYKDESAVRSYVDSHQTDAQRIVVTNTPEGMLAAAAILVESAEESQRLHDLAALFAEGTSWTEEQRDVVDTMLAALSIDDNGKLRTYLDMSGWPLALAALSGDQKAKAIIGKQREGLIQAEWQRASRPLELRTENETVLSTERDVEAVEPIPLEQLALVHTTAYDIQRDKDGTVILRSAGQMRKDKLPRASLHFTLNSRVGDVTANAQQQTWEDEAKMIVANFKAVIDDAHTLPNRMAGMDTWFTLNPGEALRLPGALIIEQVDQTESGAVIEETDRGVEYVVKDTYTDEEMDSIAALSRQYGVSQVKELALRMAMARVGVPSDLMDFPSNDGHGMFSHIIGDRIHATAAQLGIPSTKHFGTPEAYMETDAYLNLPRMLGKISMSSHLIETEHMSSYSDAAIEARRQALASGFYPARPNVASDDYVDLAYSGSGV